MRTQMRRTVCSIISPLHMPNPEMRWGSLLGDAAGHHSHVCWDGSKIGAEFTTKMASLSLFLAWHAERRTFWVDHASQGHQGNGMDFPSLIVLYPHCAAVGAGLRVWFGIFFMHTNFFICLLLPVHIKYGHAAGKKAYPAENNALCVWCKKI